MSVTRHSKTSEVSVCCFEQYSASPRSEAELLLENTECYNPCLFLQAADVKPVRLSEPQCAISLARSMESFAGAFGSRESQI